MLAATQFGVSLSSRDLPNNLKITCFVWVWNLIPQSEGRM